MVPGKATVVVVLTAIAVSTAAWAQYPGGGGGGGGSPGGPGGSRGGMGGGPRPDAMRGPPPAEAPLSAGALVQTQLDQLEDDLKLTPAQRGAWTAYADRVQKLADATARSRFDARTSAPGPSSALPQLDQIAGGMRSRTTAVEEIVDLARALYAALTPEQKAIADPRLALPVSLLVTGMAPAGMMDGAARGGRGRSP